MTPRCNAAVVLIIAGSLLGSSEAATVSARVKEAEAIISSAGRPGISDDQRDRLLDDAVNIYDRLIAGKSDSTKPEELPEVLGYRLRRVEILGEIRMQPSAGRLLLLAGADIDRRRILDFAGQVRPDLEELVREVGELVSRWRVDLEMVVGPLAKMEEINRRVQFASVVLNLYEGLSLQSGGEKSARQESLLRAAAVSAGRLAADNGIGPLKHRCYLEAGRALRMLREHKSASEQLAMASQSGAPTAVRVAGAFDFARNLIEWGRFSEAGAAIERFAELAQAETGEAKQFQVDLHKAILSKYLMKVCAARQSNRDLAERYRIEADQTLLKLIADNPQPGRREAILGCIGYSNCNQADPNGLTSLELLAVAKYLNSANQPESLPGARFLIDVLLTRQDKIAEVIRPEAMWESATIFALQNQPRQSAEQFLKLASEHVDHRLAYDAAAAAVKTYFFVQGLQSDKPAAADRREFIKALAWLTDHWPDQPEGRSWLAELGWQNENLARSESDPKLRSAYLSDAIDAYEKVVASLGPAFIESRYRAMQLRAERLSQNTGEPADKAAEAERLSGLLAAYPALVAEAHLEGDRQAAMWVAETRFLAVRIRYENYKNLDQRDESLAEMETVLPTLEGTAVFPIAAAWEISKLLDADDVRAGMRIEALIESHPDQAQPFLEEAAGQLRGHINALRRSEDQSKDMSALQACYARLTKALFDIAVRDAYPPEKMYSIKQLHADALVETGRAREAMDLFRQTSEYDRQRRLQAQVPIEKQYDGLIASVEAARGCDDRLFALADEYFVILKQHGLDVRQFSDATALAASLRRYRLDSHQPRLERRCDDLARKLSRAFAGLKQTLIAQIPVDVANPHGLARCCRAMGQTAQALKLYDEILGSLSPDSATEFYWPILLERCELLLDAYGDDRVVMDQLAGRIAHLLKDPGPERMGNLAGRFETIAARAAKPGKMSSSPQYHR